MIMYDVYLYDGDTGELVKIDRGHNKYKGIAMDWHNQGFSVKVVDTFDGVIVYTLECPP
jgi:hypothetical protein